MDERIACYNAIAALLLANPGGAEVSVVTTTLKGFPLLLVGATLTDMVDRRIIRRTFRPPCPYYFYEWVG